MSEKFKTCMFGGFDKDDVVKFIEKLAQEHQTEIAALTEEKNSLLEKLNANESLLAAADKAVDELHTSCEQYQAEATVAADLRSKLENAMSELAALRAENEALRGPAKEYESIKDHIAQIEINAHRRTEEFRSEAIAKLKDSIAQQRAWCSAQQERYEQLGNNLMQQFRRAESELEQRDLSGFARMSEELNALEESLND